MPRAAPNRKVTQQGEHTETTFPEAKTELETFSCQSHGVGRDVVHESAPENNAGVKSPTLPVVGLT
jgi:hypothetical protein